MIKTFQDAKIECSKLLRQLASPNLSGSAILNCSSDLSSLIDDFPGLLHIRELKIISTLYPILTKGIVPARLIICSIAEKHFKLGNRAASFLHAGISENQPHKVRLKCIKMLESVGIKKSIDILEELNRRTWEKTQVSAELAFYEFKEERNAIDDTIKILKRKYINKLLKTQHFRYMDCVEQRNEEKEQFLVKKAIAFNDHEYLHTSYGKVKLLYLCSSLKNGSIKILHPKDMVMVQAVSDKDIELFRNEKNLLYKSDKKLTNDQIQTQILKGSTTQLLELVNYYNEKKNVFGAELILKIKNLITANLLLMDKIQRKTKEK